MGDAERVPVAIAEAFPSIRIFTSVTDHRGLLPEFSGRRITNTWLNTVLGVQRHFKKFFMLAFAPSTRTRASMVYPGTAMKNPRPNRLSKFIGPAAGTSNARCPPIRFSFAPGAATLTSS
jgi:hypothetical protein